MRWQKALVTGASSGIGEAFARRLAGEGTAVVAVARREERLKELPGDVEVLAADLTDEADLARVEARLAVGDIDLVINNAGFGTTSRFADIPSERVTREVALDVAAVARLTRAALPPLLARGSGGVLNVSSLVGFYPSPHMATYGGAKAFVNSFTEAVAEEMRGTSVRVAVLCPGLTYSEFHQVANVGNLRNLPAMAWQTADEVARIGLDGLAAGRIVIVPGALNRTVALVTNLVPRSVVRRAAGFVQRARGAQHTAAQRGTR